MLILEDPINYIIYKAVFSSIIDKALPAGKRIGYELIQSIPVGPEPAISLCVNMNGNDIIAADTTGVAAGFQVPGNDAIFRIKG
jgi:hypothetical protein